MKEKKNEPLDNDVVIVKEKGINAKGFGHIAKRVMTDRELSITAKGIYSYLSSMAGSGSNTYTSRSKILYDLNIGNRAYDNAISDLEKRDYIHREQMRKESGQFGRNIIEFIMLPGHLAAEILKAQEEETSPTVYSGTVYALGWGSIPRLVMQDRNLSLSSRAFYAYICAYAGSTTEAFPTRDKILFELNVSKPTYIKCRKELIDNNYITVFQKHCNGLLAENIFRINHFPLSVESSSEKNLIVTSTKENDQWSKKGISVQRSKKSTSVQRSKKGVSVKDVANQGEIEYSKSNLNIQRSKKSTSVQCPKNECTVNECTVNEQSDTIYTNNSNTNNILYDRLIDTVRAKINYRILKYVFDGDTNALDAIDTIVEIMVEIMTTTQSRIVIAGKPYRTDAAIEDLQKLDNNAVCNVIDRYLAYMHKVNNKKQYLLTAIWNECCRPTEPETDEDIL